MLKSPKQAPDSHTSDASLSIKLKKRINHEWWLITIFLCILSILLTLYPNVFGTKKLENNLYDFYTNISTQKQTNKDIIIIAIDDNSIIEFGVWPWRRSIHAHLLEKLNLANSVVLDFIFTENSPFGRSDDLTLSKALYKHGNTFIPVVYNPIYGITKPIKLLSDASKGLGHINIILDNDGIVRSFYPSIKMSDNNDIAHISAASLGLYSKVDNKHQARNIKWAGAANTYEMLPYHIALSNDIDAQYFANKHVFVGAWSSGMGDTFNTSTTGNGIPMAGVEVLANIADNIAGDKQIYKTNNYWLSFFNLLFVVFTCIAVRFFSPQRAFLFILFGLVFVLTVTTIIFYYFSVWIPPIASLISIIVIYPIWSWRTQYAALQHIESELTYFISESIDLYSNDNNHKDLALNPYTAMSLELKNRILGPHTLIGLIENLHTTLESSRMSNVQRAHLLNFLSHDMRSPLNAILALCELYKNSDRGVVDTANLENHHSTPITEQLKDKDLEAFQYYAQRTLNLVDSFIDLNRAQVSTLSFRDFDLGELVINCCEESWIKAQTKNISINYDDIDYDCIINADYSLLQRVFINLINNAVQYSFEASKITVRLHQDNDFYIVQIADQGCGISDNHLEAIFSPYSRVNNNSDMHKPGVGLGLAFVQTVINRHGGSIRVESELNKGSNFIINLPVNI